MSQKKENSYPLQQVAVIYDKPTKAMAEALLLPGKRYKDWLLHILERIYVRTILSERQNHRCCFCGVRTTEQPKQKYSATIEHIKPRGEGGTDDDSNLAMSCYSCNNKRVYAGDEWMTNRAQLQAERAMLETWHADFRNEMWKKYNKPVYFREFYFDRLSQIRSIKRKMRRIRRYLMLREWRKQMDRMFPAGYAMFYSPVANSMREAA